MTSGLLLFAAVAMTPDYAWLTVPAEIAPLNFDLDREARVTLTSSAGGVLRAGGRRIRFRERPWRDFLAAAKGGWYELRITGEDGAALLTATNRVSADPIDPFLTYRLIPPSYGAFDAMGIYERDLTSFRERALYETRQTERGQCVNCHTTNRGDPETFLFHKRAVDPGTVIASPKYGLFKHPVRHPGAAFGSGTYPAWHPGGDYIAFSVNETRQSFFLASAAKLEVADLQSDLVLYNLADRRVIPVDTDPKTFECFPAWSPDGRTLYSVQAKVPFDIDPTNEMNRTEAVFGNLAVLDANTVRYAMVERKFDEKTLSFSPPQTVVSSSRTGMSVLFPRITPDGRYAFVTIAAFGVFPIWHRESDLAIVDLKARSLRVASELNSPEADSYHTISSNGRWLVFSSRRVDGVYTRPFFAHFDPATVSFSKPFILPVENPDDHARRFLSYNIPEFAKGPVRYSRSQLRRVPDVGGGGGR